MRSVRLRRLVAVAVPVVAIVDSWASLQSGGAGGPLVVAAGISLLVALPGRLPVRLVAAAAGARVDHGDLTALLYAQGIPKSEWVTA